MNIPDWVTLILPFIGGLGGIATLGTWILNWRKAKPEIARMYEEMATKQAEQIDQLRTRVNSQGKKIRKQESTIARMTERLEEWEIGIRSLIEQLVSNGLEPIWAPEEDDLADVD